MKHKLFFLLLLFTTLTFSQQEASVWYFGNKAGLKFKPDGSVVALTDGQMITEGVSAVLADKDGNFLFYTDGVTVWNKNHQVMQNGTDLFANWFGVDAVTIVPKPGTTNLFYIFVAGSSAFAGSVNDFRYSVVDMSLNGGLGAVTSEKDILVNTPYDHAMAVVKHANNTDYWVVMHDKNSNVFYSYLLTSSGLSSIPVQSNAGTIDNRILNMKISPDGSKLAICGNLNLELCNFDTRTGLISNDKVLWNGPNGGSAEFSPNSEVLYHSIIGGNQDHKVIQYDLNTMDIVGTAYTTIVPNSIIPGSLQLGSNGKIYIAQFNDLKIGVINNPNLLGATCDLNWDAVDLGGRYNWGSLPTFVSSLIFNFEIGCKNLCLSQTTEFTLNTGQTVTSTVWNFGDGSTSNDINPTHTYANTGTYTVSVLATSASGTNTKNRDITISPTPIATKPQDILSCDANNDGLYNFDLTTQNMAILNGQDPNIYTIKYFANVTDYANKVAVLSPNNYINKVPYQQETIIAEVFNKVNGECKSTTTFSIDVFDTPKPNTSISNLTICDNSSVGTDNDGKVAFDLTQKATNILNGQSATQFLISYYKDAGLTQPILTPAAYQNTNPIETIYVKEVNKDNLNCTATTSFKIEVLALPIIANEVNLKQCDDDIDGFSVFNLEEAINKITANASVENITFFKTALEAQNNTNPILNPTNYTNQSVSIDKVFIRVTNGTGCFRVGQLNLIVSTTQIPLTFKRNFTQCDDEISGTNTDGIASFDFSRVTNQIQNIFPAGQQLDITYYRNVADALAEKNAIIDVSNYRNIGYPNTQNIYVRVDSRLNNDCLGLGSHITLTVEPIPKIQLTGNELVCSNLPTFTKTINAGLVDETQKANFTYVWTMDGNSIANETNYDLTVNEKGIYKVKSTSSAGCSATRTITVNASDKATVKVDIVDLSSENSITVFATGTGDYVFSLDSENSDYQSSNIFTNVPAGIHTIFVKDLNGCGIVPQEVAILGIPNYFTPNQDGYNDTWNIKGVNNVFNSKTSVRIFDRYGKLIKETDSMGDGWDGTYMGHQMPATDYWYSIQLQDGRVFKGHFALKR
ncbi:T9SS type B sorting domain-containing protein [Flavobacterium gilvum]|uniref:PKD domain-containing protein n=1 Tax=Flavobacterium gilvum TaxID=1492737 RepID=A0AAC9I5Y4_9FLAO|nr:T9SS type B sorting domain-containing protein [Flavobacterium gilvum]AOW09981.1 hypothetical protein EM308_10930 [Flavobacterium gilvum]KFC58006.1 hypothetical protein FEM08_32160 [Flavobacterium gilvum]